MKLLRDMLEVIKTLNRKQPSKIYCPKCGSSELHLSVQAGYDPGYRMSPQKYACKRCGYVGPIFMEHEKEES